MKNFKILIIFLVAIWGGINLQNIRVEPKIVPQETLSITDDQFIQDAVENEGEVNKIETTCLGFKSRYKTIKHHYNDRLDTIYVYFNNNDTVTIYHAIDKKIILNMNLTSKTIRLLKDTIMIGLRKDYFTNKYSCIKDNDVFEICSTEGQSWFQFIIRKGILINIQYQTSYLD